MYQKVLVIGRVGQDPELRYTASGQAVCNFSVAANQRWKDSQTGEDREKTVWFRVTTWGAQAESCEKYLSKGRLVMVEGAIEQAHAWVGNDGQPRASIELTARVVRFLSSPDQGQSRTETGEFDVPPLPAEEDLPF